MVTQGQIQSLDRAFFIIDIIAEAKRPLSLKTITELTQLPKPTVYRFLSSLETWGYVQYVGTGYKLGIKFLSLGHRVQEDLEIRRVARPFLEKLNAEVNETIFLGVLDNGKGLYLDKLDSNHSIRLVSRIGSRNFLHSTGLGKSLLVGLSDAEIRNIVMQKGMPKMAENTITDIELLLAEIKDAQVKGYVIDNIENEEGVRCIAAPVKDYRGKVIASISISGPAQRITDETIEDKLRPALLKTVAEISQALGYISRSEDLD